MQHLNLIRNFSKVVGINLGTINSSVAVFADGQFVMIPSEEGLLSIPSVVAYTPDGDCLVGRIAKSQALKNPENTFYSVKHFIGRTFNEVSDKAKQVSYKIVNRDGKVLFECPVMGKQFAPEEILAKILRKLVDNASRYLGQTITQAVLTVPASFNNSQRLATIKAGKIADIEMLGIINEPTAASLAYGCINRRNKRKENILVFDLGDYKLDVSVIEVDPYGEFEVLNTFCNTYSYSHPDGYNPYSNFTPYQFRGNDVKSYFSCDDFNKKIVDYLAEKFKENEGIELPKDRQVLQRLTEAAEKAKIDLSSVNQVEINLPFITATQDGPKHLHTTLTRVDFEELCSDLIDSYCVTVEKALRDTKLNKQDIDEIVLVGGSTRSCIVRKFVKEFFGKDPNQSVNPDEVVTVGAAIQAGVLAGDIEGIFCLDIALLSLGVEGFSIGGAEHSYLKPFPILPGIYSSSKGLMTKIIPRNSRIPVKKSKVLTTSENKQTEMEIHIVEGEREFVNDNKSLGYLRLVGIPRSPRGVPQIEVIFDIDRNGICNVYIKDKTTRREFQWNGEYSHTIDLSKYK